MRRGIRTIAGGVFVLVALAACNAILSNEDRVLRADDGGTTPGRPDGDVDGTTIDGGSDAPTTDADGGSGGLQILVTDLMSPQQVAVVNGNLYFSDKTGLGWCPVDDCSAPKRFHPNENPGAYGLAVDGNGVLVGSTNNNYVYTYPLAPTGTGSLLATATSPVGVALDGVNAYFTTADGSLWRCPRSNCTPNATLVARGGAPGGAVAVGTSVAIWGTLRVDGGAQGHLQQVNKSAVDAGTPDPRSVGRGPRTMVMVGTRLYWTATDGPVNYDGEVSKRDNGLDSLTEEFYARVQTQPWGIAVDADYVYWTVSNAQGLVKRCPIGGPFPCAAQELAMAQSYPHGIAVDATHVYWANFGDGTIARIAKP